VNPRARALASIVGAITLTSCGGGEDSAAKGAHVIAQAKAATGGDAWNRIRIWHERGQASAPQGESFEYEHWGDLHTLRVRNTHPSRPNYMVFDGNVGYACADAECSRRTPLEGVAMKTGVYLASYGYFFPDRFPASFEHRGVRVDGAVHYDVVRVRPTGFDAVELWVDQNTHYVSRLVQEPAGERTDLSDYRPVGAVLVPFVSRVAGLTVQVSTVRFDPPDADTIEFTPPAK
jgi:hypothetical protein